MLIIFGHIKKSLAFESHLTVITIEYGRIAKIRIRIKPDLGSIRKEYLCLLSSFCKYGKDISLPVVLF